MQGAFRLQSKLSEEELRFMFQSADSDGTGRLDYNEFVMLLSVPDLQMDIKVPPSNRDSRGIIQIETSTEKYFGQVLRKYNTV